MNVADNVKNILLINPKWGEEAFFPLELAVVGANLRSDNYNVVSCDTDFDSIFTFFEEISLAKIDSVIVSVLSYQLQAVTSICKRLLAINPNLPVILIGTFPSLFAEEALRKTNARYAVLGDAAKITVKLLNHIFYDAPRPKHIAFINEQDEFLQKGSIYIEQEPDTLPFADRELFDVHRYGHSYRSDYYPYAAIKTSYGCNHNCGFCNVPAYRGTNGFIARTPQSVVAEMVELKEKYAVQSIHIEDDSFFSNQKHIEQLCKEILLQKVEIPWELVNGVRPRDIDLSILPLMAKSGCKHICLGIESLAENADQEEHVHTINEIVDITKIAKQFKIGTTGYFIIGMPNTDFKQNEYTIEQSGKLGLDMVHFSAYREYPGCGFSQNRTLNRITKYEADKLASIGYKKFYFSPFQISRMLFEFIKVPALIPTVMAKTLSRFSS